MRGTQNPDSASYYTSNQIAQTNARGVTAYPNYDASGNVTTDGVNSYLYDAEGRICAVASTPVTGMTTLTGYIYNADGVRVSKGSITSWSCDPTANGYKTIQDYVIGAGGQAVSEVGVDANGTMTPQRTYVYAAGMLIATYDPNGLHFRATDWLGSFRAGTDYEGVLEDTSTMLPFGDQLAGSSSDPHHFTGKERDAESGNDYFGARYFSSSMGRFMSPDVFWKDTHVADPQSWNLYAYARNNPLRYTDPTGENATVSSSCSTDSNNHTTCNTTISASFAIYAQSGSGLTQEQMNSAASTIQSSIQNAWSGSYTDSNGTTYNVSTQVSVSVVGSESAGMKSGAQNVIGISNGDAIPGRADSYVSPKSLGAALFGGPDKGVWNINNLGDVAPHEFTHLMGVDDRTSGAVLSNTNGLNDPSVPHHATGSDFGWALREATQSVGLGLSMKNWYNGSGGALPSPFKSSSTVNVGAPYMWWK